jgi:hypothetical protein
MARSVRVPPSGHVHALTHGSGPPQQPAVKLDIQCWMPAMTPAPAASYSRLRSMMGGYLVRGGGAEAHVHVAPQARRR